MLAIASLSCMLVYQVLPQNRRFGLSSGHAPHSGFLPDRFHLLPAASSILPETDILLSGAQCHKLLSWRCLLIEADHSQPQIMGRHKKGLRLKSQPLEIPGATCQTRTDDLLITNQPLYQLSQGGKYGKCSVMTFAGGSRPCRRRLPLGPRCQWASMPKKPLPVKTNVRPVPAPGEWHAAHG